MKTIITPKKARELLKLNTRNRKLSKALVSKYAGDMRAGRWPYNGDPIRVSKDGVLLDGPAPRLSLTISAASQSRRNKAPRQL